MWAAACIAAAFSSDDIETVLRAGMSAIPPASRLYAAIDQTIAWHKELPGDWRACHARILEHYGSYHPVHTINNACLVALGLLYGAKDFGRTIGIAVHSGLDTDCNGATAGSILGAMLGANAIPAKWVADFHDILESSLVKMSAESIEGLAKRTMKFASK
jgi:hypothetical protein